MFAKAFVLALVALAAWTLTARPSPAHGHRLVYRVRPYDTLWTIARAHYGGDLRGVVWQIEQANRLHGALLRPGERLVLP